MLHNLSHSDISTPNHIFQQLNLLYVTVRCHRKSRFPYSPLPFLSGKKKKKPRQSAESASSVSVSDPVFVDFKYVWNFKQSGPSSIAWLCLPILLRTPLEPLKCLPSKTVLYPLGIQLLLLKLPTKCSLTLDLIFTLHIFFHCYKNYCYVWLFFVMMCFFYLRRLHVRIILPNNES